MERKESNLAGQRMGEDYNKALARLEQKLANDRKTLELTYQTKRTNLEHERQKSLYPAKNRAAKIQHQKDAIEFTKKQNEREQRAKMLTRKSEPQKPLPKTMVSTIQASQKLVLPPINKIIRPATTMRAKK